jgi:hypothetical protein
MRYADRKAIVFGFIALVVFVMSALVHLLTFVPGAPVSMHWTWPLHLAALVVFGLMFWQGPLLFGRAVVNRGSFMQRLRESQNRNRQMREAVFSFMPRYLIVACIAMLAYAIINIVLFATKMSDGSPEEKNGKYFLEQHGKVIREIDQAEFRRLEALEARGFSGHWMIFSFVPAVYFFFVHGRVRELVGGVGIREREIVDRAVVEANPPSPRQVPSDLAPP